MEVAVDRHDSRLTLLAAIKAHSQQLTEENGADGDGARIPGDATAGLGEAGGWSDAEWRGAFQQLVSFELAYGRPKRLRRLIIGARNQRTSRTPFLTTCFLPRSFRSSSRSGRRRRRGARGAARTTSSSSSDPRDAKTHAVVEAKGTLPRGRRWASAPFAAAWEVAARAPTTAPVSDRLA